jgi:hypothetical protein
MAEKTLCENINLWKRLPGTVIYRLYNLKMVLP